jgi:hypothetical protein
VLVHADRRRKSADRPPAVWSAICHQAERS